MNSSVIVSGARTPNGRLLGSLASFSAPQLGGVAITGALKRANLAPTAVQYVILGQVLQSGVGQLPARQAAVAAGIPMTTPALTINKVCLSGLNAIALADQLIRLGEFDTIVAGGMESMTNAPHLLPRSRQGYKYGTAEMVDSMAYDGLTDSSTGLVMGELTEKHNVRLGISRAAQDSFAARSHQLAAAATHNGVFADEIVPCDIPVRGGNSKELATDEGIRPDTTLEALGRLRPAFTPDGAITAGSSSPISDGAAVVVVMSKTKAEELGIRWLAEIKAHSSVAGPDSSLQLQPASAISRVLNTAKLSVADLDLIEINEAFAAVVLASVQELKLSPQRVDQIVNVNGGAIALGHPIGASGARLVLHLALELRRRGGGFGVAALCGGGGQGDALLLEIPRS